MRNSVIGIATMAASVSVHCVSKMTSIDAAKTSMVPDDKASTFVKLDSMIDVLDKVLLTENEDTVTMR